MRAITAALVLLLAVFPTAAQEDTKPGKEEAVAAAEQFGRALRKADSSLLQPLLPRRGKVRLRLVRLGPEQGTYSAGQVAALLSDFLRQGSVHTFDIVRTEGDAEGGGYALIHARAALTDAGGRSGTVDLHLTLVREEGRWTLRELRETSP